jgi:hypothetical protein
MARKQQSKLQVVRPFSRKPRKQKTDLRDTINGAGLLGQLQVHLNALEALDGELEDSVQDFERNIMGEDGEVLRVEKYRSTVLDKETIAVYHTRQAGRKVQIDTILKMLNKVMPDLKAIENTDDIGDVAARALVAFAEAAKT